MRSIHVFLVIVGIVSAACAQTGTKPKAETPKMPAGVPAAPHVVAGQETVTGRKYSNPSLGFEVTFPEGWVISGDGFDTEAKKAGDLGLKAPENIGQVNRIRLDKSLKNVSMLVTAYRPSAGTSKGAVIRISLENLSPNPQIKDAIDYFDAIRNEYTRMSLPADFRYSETQAERLGKQQFAFLDLSSSVGMKRLYATVRRGYAVMFSLSYTRDEDLQSMRQMLSAGSFALK